MNVGGVVCGGLEGGDGGGFFYAGFAMGSPSESQRQYLVPLGCARGFGLRSGLRQERWPLRVALLERPKAEALGYLEATSGNTDRTLRDGHLTTPPVSWRGPHLIDDETVAKMGHPDLDVGHPATQIWIWDT
jgi:hypothetical protein